MRLVLLCSLVPFFSILSLSWIWFGSWLALVVDVDVDVGGGPGGNGEVGWDLVFNVRCVCLPASA